MATTTKKEESAKDVERENEILKSQIAAMEEQIRSFQGSPMPDEDGLQEVRRPEEQNERVSEWNDGTIGDRNAKYRYDISVRSHGRNARMLKQLVVRADDPATAQNYYFRFHGIFATTTAYTLQCTAICPEDPTNNPPRRE